MGRVEQLRLIVNFVILVIVSGCATSARDLPHEHGSLSPLQRVISQPHGAYELERSCQDIKQEVSRIDASLFDIEQSISAARANNQAAGLISATLFFPVIVAANQQSEDRKRYDDLNTRKEWLMLLSVAKACA